MPFIFSILLSFVLVLSGCGGGGSTDSPNNVTTPASVSAPSIVTDTLAFNLLLQASFGPTDESIAAVKRKGLEGWVDYQINLPSPYDAVSPVGKTNLHRVIEISKMNFPAQFPNSIASYLVEGANFNGTARLNRILDIQTSVWFEKALDDPAQLRQRVAFALSQILVISNSASSLSKRAEGIAYYNDILTKHAFGNFRDLLKEVSLSPAMGIYLTHQGNKKASADGLTHPDENYARELMQLFSIGLFKLNPDGSKKIDRNSNYIVTYSQQDVEEMARVFTGWDLRDNRRYGDSAFGRGNYTQQMECTNQYHDFGAKTILGSIIPAGLSCVEDVEAAIDILMSQPSMAPFISKQLIMRLVTSNPSPAYIARVSHVFNNDGFGVKGNLGAVIKAILLDPEAIYGRQQNVNFGKLKEPIIALTQMLRAFDVKKTGSFEGISTGSLVEGAYWFRRIGREFPQVPFRANSVFNFYSPDFIPSTTHFSARQLKAPEMQIQTDVNLIDISNYFFDILNRHEKNKIIDVHGSLVNYEKTRDARRENLYISFTEELSVLLNSLDGNYANLHSRGGVFRQKAVENLLTHLNRKLTNNALSIAHKQVITNYFVHQAHYVGSNVGAQLLVRDMVHMIVSSQVFMVQH